MVIAISLELAIGIAGIRTQELFAIERIALAQQALLRRTAPG